MAALPAAVLVWKQPPAASRPASGAPHFTDIAPRSRFSYTSNNDFTGRKYFPQPMCGGIAVLDYDRDGKVDLFFTTGAKLPPSCRR